MTPDQRAEVLTKDAIPEWMAEAITKVGVKTGSTVLGGFDQAKSDVDFLIHLGSCGFNIGILESYAVGVSKYDDESITFNLLVKGPNNVPWNLIFCVTDEAFDIWTTTTRSLLRLINTEPLIKKALLRREKRVDLFKAFRRILGDPSAIDT
jgi:hypothetical protein